MINRVILVGRVGRDPEVRHLDNNATVARFTLATSESYKNKNGEKVTNTEWHNIVVWRSLAEIAGRYIKKGTLLYVEGKIRNRSWDDKDGNKRYTTEIDAENFQMLSARSDENGSSGQGFSNAAPSNTPDYSSGSNDFAPTTEPTDDLPF
ncbi:MAG: single-stranded DNA-binding protein [Bacteroidota bacterium]|nr:single-stranded DNA-binding protein [Bacteroidota bacterium]